MSARDILLLAAEDAFEFDVDAIADATGAG